MIKGCLVIAVVSVFLIGTTLAVDQEGGGVGVGRIEIKGGRGITIRERDYSAYCVRREWDRLQTWHAGDFAKRCYQLGNPQQYPDRVYDRMLAHCETLEEYDCSFTSSTQFYEDQQTRLEESKRAYEEKYNEAHAKCQTAKEHQKACINKVSGQDADKACPLEDKACLAPILSEMRSWVTGTFRESEFCIQKKRYQ